MDIQTFFAELWNDYIAMTPQAQRIKAEFEARGETVENDHVAFRTLALDPINLASLEPHILALGYTRFEPYEFPEKKLKAQGYLPPSAGQPRVFLSELLVDKLSPPAQAVLRRIAGEVDPARVARPDVLWSGRLWKPIKWEEYELLQAESEYAAWLASIGIRPNHFTISVNGLKQHPEVEDVLRVVEEIGCRVNESGGRVKGSRAVLLEQGSTMADRVEQPFADGVHEVPTCYYEFAKRYPKPDGKLFDGFVAASADKIFESTDAKGGRS
ncbi:MAG: DUF1338 domain-containing protein [Planctomycetales bacterium]|nr:DUF1338 domain-containing protein [Planctomycetales bacterium]